MKLKDSTWAATVSLVKGGPPDAQCVIVSVDSSGSPGGLKNEVLTRLGVSHAIVPKFDALTNGYNIVVGPPARGHLICFVVTVGASGLTPDEALKTNLAKCLRDENMQTCSEFWLPLMGTGAGGLRFNESLAATLDAFDASGMADRAVSVTISAPPTISDDDFEALHAVAISGPNRSSLLTWILGFPCQWTVQPRWSLALPRSSPSRRLKTAGTSRRRSCSSHCLKAAMSTHRSRSAGQLRRRRLRASCTSWPESDIRTLGANTSVPVSATSQRRAFPRAPRPVCRRTSPAFSERG